MKLKIKNAFTLTEMIIVVAIIWVLMMWMTVYMWWYDERTKIIEAQGCAATLWWELDNYVFYALTSKKLKIGNDTVSPSAYFIYLTWGKDHADGTHNVCIKDSYKSSGIYCDTIALAYHESTDIDNIDRHDIDNFIYKSLDSTKCRQNSSTKLIFYRNDNTKLISMNKWFSQIWYSNNRKPFHVRTIWWYGNEDIAYGEIIVVACISWDDDCTWRKEVAKWVIDSRSQSITLKNCKFYNKNDPTTCETWEDENNEEE